ncbi:LysR family transcriptional regulator [Defluviimonas sp. WL0024]|uniref:LysR family transcriptional regulator n=2 Tax=Albidovulum TaxID=205889 RepID=A0ABT3IZW8_9RHOB|nr:MULTISPECIES: LysR family transcriptional regulator [Defluviimonas]MCU9847187.1 LysR family transcriptional regulator [Defluviimonas sp. WL0024]MCW3780987.1 LysR family transcriptional regulator [Defluviimonas salinarum]
MLSITLRQLEYATAVARAGGMTSAAEALNVSQPALSVALTQLEAQLGNALFLRRPGGPVTPTSFGRDFLDEAERILADLRRLTRGETRRAAPVALGLFEDLASLMLAPLLAGLAAERPDLTVTPRIGGFEALADDLAHGRIDLAITYDLGLDAGFERREIARLQPHAILAAAHPLAALPDLSLAALAAEPLILADQGLSLSHMRALFTRAGFDPRIAHRAHSLETMRSLAANGFGIGLSYTCPRTGHSHDGRPLVARPLTDAGPGEPIVLVRHAANPLSAAAEALAEIVAATRILAQ